MAAAGISKTLITVGMKIKYNGMIYKVLSVATDGSKVVIQTETPGVVPATIMIPVERVEKML